MNHSRLCGGESSTGVLDNRVVESILSRKDILVAAINANRLTENVFNVSQYLIVEQQTLKRVHKLAKRNSGSLASYPIVFCPRSASFTHLTLRITFYTSIVFPLLL